MWLCRFAGGAETIGDPGATAGIGERPPEMKEWKFAMCFAELVVESRRMRVKIGTFAAIGVIGWPRCHQVRAMPAVHGVPPEMLQHPRGVTIDGEVMPEWRRLHQRF